MNASDKKRLRKTDYTIGTDLEVINIDFIGDFGYQLGDIVNVRQRDLFQYHVRNTRTGQWVWLKESQVKPVNLEKQK